MLYVPTAVTFFEDNASTPLSEAPAGTLVRFHFVPSQ